MLQAVRFFANHGVHAEEALTGNEFEVDVALSFAAPEAVITELEKTANYVAVFGLVQQEMATRQQLLETVAMRICQGLPQLAPNLTEATVAIKKLNPPIAHFTGQVGIRYTHKY